MVPRICGALKKRVYRFKGRCPRSLYPRPLRDRRQGLFHIDKDSLFCYSCDCHGKGNAGSEPAGDNGPANQ